jgi:glycosyltransferase involved in cell wall biosynthesis
MRVSIVIPVYNEAEGINALSDLLQPALALLPDSTEVIFVDDGSSDDSAAQLARLVERDGRLQMVRLRRNYGQTAAMMAGMQQASGDVIVPMDADGQNDPTDIPRLLAKLDEGFDVVSGWRREREDKALTRRLPSVIANWLISHLLGVPLHDYGCTLKAYRREVIEDVRLYGEMHRFIPIFAFWEGAKVTEIVVGHHARKFGKSKYGLGRVVRVLLDLLTLVFIDRALDRPMQFFGKIGFWMLVAAISVFGWALVLKLGYGVSLIQTPLPLLATSLGLSGILFLLLGILAEIMTRTYFESRGKAPYKIKAVVTSAASPSPKAERARW